MTTPQSLFDLSNACVVITGGYGQIGRVLVRGVHALGARVAVIEPATASDITEAVFGDLARSDRLNVYAADVCERASLETALSAIESRWGPPTGLVNNAALDSPPDAPAGETGPFESYPEESWDRVMAVNAKGVFLCCQVFGSSMAAAGRGSIVNVASIYGAVSPDQSLYQYRRDRGEIFYKPVAYAASKSALYNLTRYIAVYWGPKGVRANTMTFAGVFNNQEQPFLDAYEKKIPLRRTGSAAPAHCMAEPEDYLGGVAFLLSDASGYMTGADLRIDGGFLAL